jgi:hypothetical protein
MSNKPTRPTAQTVDSVQLLTDGYLRELAAVHHEGDVRAIGARIKADVDSGNIDQARASVLGATYTRRLRALSRRRGRRVL